MPSRKPSSPVIDTSEDDASHDDALDLVEQAEAEAAEAEALAAAARARARAIRLRNEAAAGKKVSGEESADHDVDASADDDPSSESADQGESEPAETSTSPEITESAAVELAEPESDAATEAVEAEPLDEAVTEGESKGSARRLPKVRASRLFWKVLASCLTLILIIGLLGASGYMIWHHRQAQHREQMIAEYTAAARQTVVTLMSLDFNHADDAVKNILDNSTGDFRADFEAQSKDFVKLAKDAKVVTEAKVTAAAVDSMSDNSAVVLVAVNTAVTNTTGANKQPRPWRVAVDMVREGDRIKLSKVEFVP